MRGQRAGAADEIVSYKLGCADGASQGGGRGLMGGRLTSGQQRGSQACSPPSSLMATTRGDAQSDSTSCKLRQALLALFRAMIFPMGYYIVTLHMAWSLEPLTLMEGIRARLS